MFTVRGFYISFFSVLFMGFMIAANRYAVVTEGLHPFLFAALQLTVAGVALLLYAGPGKNFWATVKHPMTWAMGSVRMLDIVFYIIALLYVTGTEVEFMVALAVPFAMIFSFNGMGRNIRRTDIYGALIVIVGALTIGSRLDGGLGNPAFICAIIIAFAVATLGLLTELHPESNKALGIKDRARFTGIVVFVMGFAFLVFMGIMALILSVVDVPAGSSPISDALLDAVPPLSEFANPKQWLWAIIAGVLLRAPAMFTMFMGIRLIKNDNYKMVATMVPFCTLGVEVVLDILGLLDARTLDGVDVGAGILITIGALLTLFTRAARVETMKKHRADEAAM